MLEEAHIELLKEGLRVLAWIAIPAVILLFVLLLVFLGTLLMLKECQSQVSLSLNSASSCSTARQIQAALRDMDGLIQYHE